jgi:alpha-D-xyloside xylohydrolase
MFVHTSAPLTLDLGSYGEAAVIYLGDDVLDLFFFFGSPKKVSPGVSSSTSSTRSLRAKSHSSALWAARRSCSLAASSERAFSSNNWMLSASIPSLAR